MGYVGHGSVHDGRDESWVTKFHPLSALVPYDGSVFNALTLLVGRSTKNGIQHENTSIQQSPSVGKLRRNAGHPCTNP